MVKSEYYLEFCGVRLYYNVVNGKLHLTDNSGVGVDEIPGIEVSKDRKSIIFKSLYMQKPLKHELVLGVEIFKS